MHHIFFASLKMCRLHQALVVLCVLVNKPKFTHLMNRIVNIAATN